MRKPTPKQLDGLSLKPTVLTDFGNILRINCDAKKGTVTLSSQLRWSVRIVYQACMLIAFLTGALCLYLLGSAVDLLKLSNASFAEFILVSLCLGVFGLLLLALLATSAFGIATSFFSRRFVFDARSDSCRFRTVLGFGSAFFFDEVEALIIRSEVLRGRNMCSLYLAVTGRKRNLLIFGMTDYLGRNVETIREELMNLTQQLASFLDCSITQERDSRNAEVEMPPKPRLGGTV